MHHGSVPKPGDNVSAKKTRIRLAMRVKPTASMPKPGTHGYRAEEEAGTEADSEAVASLMGGTPCPNALNYGFPFGSDGLFQSLYYSELLGGLKHGGFHGSVDSDEEKLRIRVVELLDETECSRKIDID
jgi:hypothetical protein